MKIKIRITALLSFLTFVFSSSLFSQTILNYQTWTGATGCNIFSASTFVPATTNGTNTTIEHLSIAGQPQYDGSQKAVSLDCHAVIDNGNTIGFKGTEYRITYPFKQGYSYSITVNASCINSTNTGSNASLRLSPNSGGSGTSTQCNGDADIDPNTSGNLYRSNSITGGTTWTDYTFSWSAFSTQQPYLNLASVPPINSPKQTILIRKITITETGPELILSPTNVPTTCGTTTTQTFTVSNPNNLQGITSYEWNLGTANNGWLYNGRPADQNISTPTNSITLTSICGSNLSNVSVTVKVNNQNYKTYQSTITPTIPTLSIVGNANFCTGSSNYSINNLPCNASVNWSASPSGIVSLSCTSCANTTLTKLTDGVVSLTANINKTNSCSSGTESKSFSVTVGTPALLGPSGTPSFILTGQRFDYSANGPGTSFLVCPGENLTFMPYVPDGYTQQGVTAYQWSISGSYNSVGSLTQNSLSVSAPSSTYSDFSFTYKYQNACGWSPDYSGQASTMDCDGGQQPFKTQQKKNIQETIINSTKSTIIYPNPIKDIFNISLGSTDIRKVSISIYNSLGKQIKDIKAQSQSTSINISNLSKGIYFIKVSAGQKMTTYKIIKN